MSASIRLGVLKPVNAGVSGNCDMRVRLSLREIVCSTNDWATRR